jgi:hypothetical protein
MYNKGETFVRRKRKERKRRRDAVDCEVCFIHLSRNISKLIINSNRSDFYQTSSTVIASIYLKKIDKESSTIKFTSPTSIELDLHTSDKKRYTADFPLYGKIDPEKSSFRIVGTKLELTMAKADGAGWPVLKSTDPHTGSIIQAGRAGTA